MRCFSINSRYMESIYYMEEAAQGATWQGQGQGVRCGAGGLHLLCIEAGTNVENGTVGNARVIEHGHKLARADVKTIFVGDPMIGDTFNTNFPRAPLRTFTLVRASWEPSCKSTFRAMCDS